MMRKIPLMDSDVIEFKTLETSCVYLEDKRMQMSYKYIQDCSFRLNSELTKKGWRRFGNYYSRPSCKECDECKSLRIDVDKFTFSKNAKRVIKKNNNTKVILSKPTVTIKHLQLYEKYHLYMKALKGWEYYPLTKDSYIDLYIKGASTYGYEVQYIIDDKLVGLDLIDIIDDGISAIYFFYDPDFSKLSLGKFSIYKQIDLAKKKNLKWIYMGYCVDKCPSLSYKKLYRPHQILKNNPDLDDIPIWS